MTTARVRPRPSSLTGMTPEVQAKLFLAVPTDRNVLRFADGHRYVVDGLVTRIRRGDSRGIVGSSLSLRHRDEDCLVESGPFSRGIAMSMITTSG